MNINTLEELKRYLKAKYEPIRLTNPSRPTEEELELLKLKYEPAEISEKLLEGIRKQEILAAKPLGIKEEFTDRDVASFLKQVKKDSEIILERLKGTPLTVGKFIAYNLMVGVNEFDANLVNLGRLVTQGVISLSDKIEELIGKPENFLDPYKARAIESITNLIQGYEQKAQEWAEKARETVAPEGPVKSFVVEALSSAIRSLPQIVVSFVGGLGMPQPAGIAARLPSAQFYAQASRMVPFTLFAGSAHAREIEKELEEAGLEDDGWKTSLAFIIGGLAEAATESPVFEAFIETLGAKGVERFAISLLKDIAVNAAQEAVMEPIEMAYKEVLGLPQDWSLRNVLERSGAAGLSGALLGLMMSTALHGSQEARERVGKVLQKYAEKEVSLDGLVREVTDAVLEETQRTAAPEGIEIPETVEEQVEIGEEISEKVPEEISEETPEETTQEVAVEEEGPPQIEPETPEEVPQVGEEGQTEEAAPAIWQLPFEEAVKIIDPYWQYSDNPEQALQQARSRHYLAVKQAVLEDLEVPTQVIQEYAERLFSEGALRDWEVALRNIASEERARQIAAEERGIVVPDNANEGKWMVLRKTKALPREAAPRRKTEGISRAATATHVEPVSKLTIRRFIEKEFGVPLRGKATERWRKTIMGMYYHHPKIIRLRGWGDLATMAHELGHHLFTRLFVDLPHEAIAEAASLDYDQTKQRPEEGFAEYFSFRLVLGHKAVAKMAPTLHASIERNIRNNPELASKISRLEELYRRYREQSTPERILQHIAFEEEKTPLREKIEASWRYLQKEFFYQYASLHRMMIEAKAIAQKLGIKLSPLNDPEVLIKYFRRRAGAWARTIVLDKFVDEFGYRIGPSLKEVLEPIPPEKLREFLAYVVCKRAAVLHKRGIVSGLDPDDVAQYLKMYANPVWDKTAKRLTEWCNTAISLLVRAGGLSEAAAKKIRELNPFYITFKRVLDEAEATAGIGAGKRLANLPPVVRRIMGSERMLDNVLDATIEHVTNILSRVQKLHIIRSIIELQEKIPGLGKWIVEVPPPVRPVEVRLDEFSSIIKELTGKKLSKEQLEEIITFFIPSPYTTKPNIVSLWYGGKRRWFEVDPELYTELMAADAITTHSFFKIARAFTDLVRLGAVEINPAFAAANFLRDLMTFMVRSKAKFPHPLDTLIGIIQAITAKPGSPVWAAMKMGLEISSPAGLYLAATQELSKELIYSKMGWKGKLLNFFMNPAAFIERILQVVELGPRVREFWKLYNEYLKEGKSEVEAFVLATVAGREVTIDFSEGGNLCKALNIFIPFFSANVQGPVQVLRSLKERPVQTIFRGLTTLTLLALLLWWRNKDEPWYKNLRPEFKYNNLFLKLDDETILRFPLPWEIGILFAGLPVAVLDYLKEKDERLYRGIVGMLERILPDLEPAILKPIIDILRNRTFSGAPIESRAMQYEYETERKREDTTKIAVLLSKALDKLGVKISPIKLDYILNQYTGGLYKRVATLIKGITKKEGIEEILKETAVAKRFTLSSPHYPSYQLDRYFSDLEELQKKQKSQVITKEEQRKLKKLSSVLPFVRKLLDARRRAIEEEKDTESIDKKIAALLKRVGYE